MWEKKEKGERKKNMSREEEESKRTNELEGNKQMKAKWKKEEWKLVRKKVKQLIGSINALFATMQLLSEDDLVWKI